MTWRGASGDNSLQHILTYNSALSTTMLGQPGYFPAGMEQLSTSNKRRIHFLTTHAHQIKMSQRCKRTTNENTSRRLIINYFPLHNGCSSLGVRKGIQTVKTFSTNPKQVHFGTALGNNSD